MATNPAAIDPTPHFQAAMVEMRAHYLSGAQQPFNLDGSVHVQRFRAMAVMNAPDVGAVAGSDQDTGDGEDLLADIKSTAHDSFAQSSAAQQSGAQAAATQVASDKDADSFKAKMDAQRQKAITDSTATINKAYDDATTVGNNNPDKQDEILNGMNALSTGLNGVASALTNVIGGIMSSVSDLISGLLKPIEGIASAFGPVAAALAFL